MSLPETTKTLATTVNLQDSLPRLLTSFFTTIANHADYSLTNLATSESKFLATITSHYPSQQFLSLRELAWKNCGGKKSRSKFSVFFVPLSRLFLSRPTVI